MTEFFCSCGFWASYGDALTRHIRDNSGHYRVDKRRWTKIVAESESRKSNAPKGRGKDGDGAATK